VKVQAKFLRIIGHLCRLSAFTSAGSIAYMPDNEPYEPLKMQLATQNGIDGMQRRNFAATERANGGVSAGLRSRDSGRAYTDEEYAGHIGWGHSPFSSVSGSRSMPNVKRALASITTQAMTMT